MLCGGTVDRVGVMNGQLWIIDLKCVQRLYQPAVQTAGYELLLPKSVVPGRTSTPPGCWTFCSSAKVLSAGTLR
jgi:hypothetical protein